MIWHYGDVLDLRRFSNGRIKEFIRARVLLICFLEYSLNRILLYLDGFGTRVML